MQRASRVLPWALLALPVALACVARAAPSTSAPIASATILLPMPPAADSRLIFPPGFSATVVANVGSAREMATLPNGDLLIGTGGRTIYLLPRADAPTSGGKAHPFITLPEAAAQGVTVAPNGAIYASTQSTIWKIPYETGDQIETVANAIAHVRTGSIAPDSDGDVHRTTSVAASATRLYAGVGSSCNACLEVDPTRASVQEMKFDGSSMLRLAENSRNPMALAVDPATGNLWIGGAGQDDLPAAHPFEYVDSPTLRGGTNVDYGWPACEENHHAYNPLGQSPAPDCSKTVAPAIEFPAYSTLIGATFYPANESGPYAFPAPYKGGLFVTAHGSWHCCPSAPPRVYFVAMRGDTPASAVNWNDPTTQSRPFVSGYGTTASNAYFARATGIAVGSNGSLFVADDRTGNIIRIRYR